MRKIGVTGGVGSGKSQVLDFLRDEIGACVVKADEVGHEQMEPGTEGYEEIVRHFGRDILAGGGTINRQKLGTIVFADPAELAFLNGVIHPAVKKEILRRMEEEEKKGTDIFVLEAALLLEAGYRPVLDEIWYIYVENEVRIERLMLSRGYSREKCLDIMKQQKSEDFFRKEADVILDNSGTWEETVHAICEHCQRKQR